MKYNSYTKGEGWYEFIADDMKLLVPESDVILIDDESGALTIKNIVSRCSLGVVPKE